MRVNAPNPCRHSRSPDGAELEQRRAAVLGVRVASDAVTRLEPPHDVGRCRQRHPELGRDFGEPHGAADADQAQDPVAVGVDPVRRQLALDQLRHPLVRGDEPQQQGQAPLRPLRGGAGLRA